MMRLPPFQFSVPSTLDDAIQMLADAGPAAKLVAGGTDLYPNMKRRQEQPTVVIGLQDLRELVFMNKTEEGGVSIGSGVTLTHLQKDRLIQKNYPALAEAILTISTPLLRNMGTLGGNLCLDTRCHFLNQSAFWRQAVGSCMKAEGDICRVARGSPRCWAITSADLPPLLIALGASIRLVGSRGKRTILLAELYRDDGVDYLAKSPDEILTAVVLPPAHDTRATYLKLRRRDTFDFPALGVAAALQIDPDGTCRSAKIVLGAITSRPFEIPEVETLVGEKITADTIQAVSETAMRTVKPLHLADYDHYYRKQMVGLYMKRALERLI